MKKRTVAIFTGNRAEYGLQFPILRAVSQAAELEYRLIVSGAHLDPNFGQTLEEIRADGFEVHAEVRCDLESDTLYATAKAIGSGVVSMSQALDRIRPDILVVYADRFEGLAAVVAGSQMGIPTAHVEGGDLTEGGALDDSVRHAMTKLSHLHFTTNQQASNRLLAMGEEAWRVHTVGFPAIDLIQEGRYASPTELQEAFGIDFNRPVCLFTQHSVTTEFEVAGEQIAPSLSALARLASDGVQVIATYPNNDAGGRHIIDLMQRWSENAPAGVVVRKSLGRHRYHGVLALAKNSNVRVACVGNSSSGIKETPAFGCPTVNIGTRQQGRLRASNVIDVGYDSEDIYGAVRTCLYDEAFRDLCRRTENPYGMGDAGIKIARVLSSVPLDHSLIRKGMTLKGETEGGWFR